MANTSDSQITRSVGCLSLPSEPPDIRNWFSSYKYESFVLDTYVDFGGSVFQEHDSEGHGCVIFGEKGKGKEANLAESRRNVENDYSLENGFPSKMPDSRESPSLLSEPPPIRNWFSSYVYKSPSLDTIDNFRSPASEESESEKDGSASDSDGSPKVKEKNFEESNGSGNCNEVAGENLHLRESVKCENTFRDCSEDDSLNQISDFPQFSSLPSEPPDIRNWFSSFVYQSPLSCKINGFLEETARNEDGFHDEDSNTEKAINVEKFGQTRITDTIFHDKARSNQFSKFDRPAGDDEENKLHNETKKFVRKEYLATVEDLHCEKEQILKDKVLSVCLVKDAEKASLNNDGHICKRKNEQSCPGETGLFLFKNKTKTRITDGKSSRTLVDKNDFTENLNTKPETEVDLQSPIKLMRKLTNGADDKENQGSEVPGNGFVTTRRSRILRSNDQNFNRTRLVVLECSRNKGITSPDDERGIALKRRVLSERVNSDPTANAMENTGKWHCPQTSKPNIRPPAKQLRLEQWFHRV